MPIEFGPPPAQVQPYQIQPVQYTDPLQTLAQMGQLRTQNLQQQNAQLQLKQAQMQMDSNKAMMQALIDGGGDYDKTTQAIAQHPDILPSDYFAYQQHAINALKDRAALTETQQKIQDHDNQQWSSILNPDGGINSQTDLNNAVTQGVRQGLKVPATLTTPDGQLLPFSGDPAHYKMIANTLLLPAQLSQEKLQTAQAQEAAAKATESQATAAKTTLETQQTQARINYIKTLMGSPFGLSGLVNSFIDPTKYPDLNKRALAGATQGAMMSDPKAVDDAIQKYATIASEQEKTIATETNPLVVKTREDVARVNAQNRLNISLQGLGTADQPSTAAQMVADYQVPLSSALARVPLAGRQIFLSQVQAANPDFQEQYYPAFQKTEESATSGKIATSANALNTMMGHLTVLNQAADALNNGDIPLINKIANSIGVATGQTAKTTFDTIVHRLGPEVTSAYLAAGGTAGERGTNEEDFSSNLAPAQIKQNIGISAYLADSKIKALQDQYQRGTYGRGKQQLISNEADAARQTLTQQAPANLRGGGSTPYVRQMMNTKTKHVIGQTPDGKWHDVQTGAVIQ